MMGRFKSVNTVVTMLAACAVFVGFRAGIFSFAAPVILPFVIAALAAGAAIVLLVVMARAWADIRAAPTPSACCSGGSTPPITWSPWPMAVRSASRSSSPPGSSSSCWARGRTRWPCCPIATYFVGSWFAPLLGRMMDKLGTRKMLWLESGLYPGLLHPHGRSGGNAVRRGAGHRRLAVLAGLRRLCAVHPVRAVQHGPLLHDARHRPGPGGGDGEPCPWVSAWTTSWPSPSPPSWHHLGPPGVSYVFYLAALSCVLQLAAAHLVGRKNPSKSVPQ